MSGIMVSQELYQEMIYVMLVGMVFLFISLTYNYVQGIDYMNENHPDYKGEDMFGEEEN
jgi:Na+-transporting methylmalonyl-CoA/oxaloacetate decarboxylase gamma subunit